jgi:hypothetical protein
MMDTLILYFGTGLTALAGIAIVAITGLQAFRGWLDLKRAEIVQTRDASPPSTVTRIDVADLKERIRKLEAIAAGVDI